VASWFATERAWERFRKATKGRLRAEMLVPLLDDATRTAWLAHTAPRPEGVVEDPVLAARRAATVRVGESLAAVVAGRPDALSSADVVKLRGPRLVGEVVSRDPKFVWEEFRPRPGDSGDDAMFGRGVEEGRVPGRLWGNRPGDAWYVLEAIARWREKAPDAPYVPLESTSKGDETTKTLLAVRTAEALGDVPLALTLDEAFFADLGKRERLFRRLRLLVKGGRKDDANALLVREVRSRQAKGDESSYLAWQGVAKDLGLATPLEALDPASPLSPALLAYLYDAEGPERAAAFRTRDVSEFRMALAQRWIGAGAALSKEKTVRYLDELWVERVAAYPAASARKLGPVWVAAQPYLEGVDVRLRRDALAAVRSLPATDALRALVEKTQDSREETRTFLMGAELAASRDDAALAILDQLLASTNAPSQALRYDETSPTPAPDAAGAEGEGGEEAGVAPVAREAAAPAPKLTAWLRIFRKSKRPDAIAKAEARLAERLKRDLDGGAAGFDVWSLALELSTSREALDRVLLDLERSWVRGEWPREGDREALVSLLVPRDAAAASRWFDRLDPSSSFAATASRTALLVKRKETAAARHEWVEARRRLAFTRDEDEKAFDAWRRLPAPAGEGTAKAGKKPLTAGSDAAPAVWKTAATFWARKGADLDAWGDTLTTHLAAHPYD
ncbi:MAG TPA: hypothetical protein VGR00_03065, partial [Thermoanaerobaculia bacterium]|nr:hypothetical protein [Thermoanaerobaculia bacterium]